MIACYTAIMGGYDDLKPHPEIPGVDWIAFSDTIESHPAWDVRHDGPSGEHPRDAAKEYKLFPDLFLPEYEHTIWIDGSHEITNPRFVEWALGSIGESDIALYRHPWRDCIYDEAKASLELQKYDGQPITEQVNSYRGEHPEHWGLWATGTLARRNTPQVAALMSAWSDEMDKWSYQDQLSFPVVCRRLGVTPEEFPCGQVVGNTWHTIHGHKRED